MTGRYAARTGVWSTLHGRYYLRRDEVTVADEENPTTLTAHSWHGEKGIFNQGGHVRPAVRDNGFWTVYVSADGDYEFELRRWPVEADTPICSGLPGRTGVPFVDDLVPGEALTIKAAKLQVGDVVKEKVVSGEDKGVAFRLSLKAGSTRVQTWFDDGGEESLGAYYVYVRKL